MIIKRTSKDYEQLVLTIIPTNIINSHNSFPFWIFHISPLPSFEQFCLTHNTVDEDEDKVEKDDEPKSTQEDDTVHRVDLHSPFFRLHPPGNKHIDILQVNDNEVIST